MREPYTHRRLVQMSIVTTCLETNLARSVTFIVAFSKVPTTAYHALQHPGPGRDILLMPLPASILVLIAHQSQWRCHLFSVTAHALPSDPPCCFIYLMAILSPHLVVNSLRPFGFLVSYLLRAVFPDHCV